MNPLEHGHHRWVALNQECEKTAVTSVLGIAVRLRVKEAKSWLCTWLGRILPRRGDRGVCATPESGDCEDA